MVSGGGQVHCELKNDALFCNVAWQNASQMWNYWLIELPDQAALVYGG